MMRDFSSEIEKSSEELASGYMGEEDLSTMVDEESRAADSLPSVPSVAKKRFSSGAADDNVPVVGMRRTSDTSCFPKNQIDSTAPSEVDVSWHTMAGESNAAASLAKDRFSTKSDDRVPVNKKRRSTLTEAFARFSLFSKNDGSLANDRFGSGRTDDQAPAQKKRNSSLSEGVARFSFFSNVSNLSNNESTGAASLADDRFSAKTDDRAPVRRDRRVSHRFSIFNSDSNSESMFLRFISPMFQRVERIEEDESYERKSTLCCGSCCDVVWGCIMVDILNICVSILLLYIGLQNDMGIREFLLVVDEDETGLLGFTVGLVRIGIMIPVALIGILGALRFNKHIILCVAVWYAIDITLAIIILSPIKALLSALYFYAHIHLFLELKNGTITEKNYERTEQYCCCSCFDMDRTSRTSIETFA